MNRWSTTSLVWATAFTLTSGCVQGKDALGMKPIRPGPPPEMQQLQPLVGQWETSAETSFVCLNRVLPIKGLSRNSWEADGWYMMERGEYEMGEIGQIHERGVWTWNPASRKFATWRVDSFGGLRVGTAQFDEDSRIWKVTARRQSPWGSSRDRGKIKIVDDETLEWTWEEWPAWDVLRLFKIAEYRGKSWRLNAPQSANNQPGD